MLLSLICILEPLALSAWGFVIVGGHFFSLHSGNHREGMGHQMRSASAIDADFMLILPASGAVPTQAKPDGH